jgi:hypothetical protein
MFIFASKILPKKKFLHKKYVKRNFAKHLISLYPSPNKDKFIDFVFLRRFFFKNTNIFSVFYRSRRIFQFKFLKRFRIKTKIPNKFPLKKLLVSKINNLCIRSNPFKRSFNSVFVKKIKQLNFNYSPMFDEFSHNFDDIFFLKDLSYFSKKILSSNFLHLNIEKKFFIKNNQTPNSILRNVNRSALFCRVTYLFIRKLYNLIFLFKSEFFVKKKKNFKKYTTIKRLFIFYVNLMPILLTDNLIFVFFRKYFFSKPSLPKNTSFSKHINFDFFLKNNFNFTQCFLFECVGESSCSYISVNFFFLEINIVCKSTELGINFSHKIFFDFDLIKSIVSSHFLNFFKKPITTIFSHCNNPFFNSVELQSKKKFFKLASTKHFKPASGGVFFKFLKQTVFYSFFKKINYRFLKHKFAHKTSGGRKHLTIKPQRLNMVFFKNTTAHQYKGLSLDKNLVSNNILTVHMFNIFKKKIFLADNFIVKVSPVYFFENFFYLNFSNFFKKTKLIDNGSLICDTNFSIDNFISSYSCNLYFNLPNFYENYTAYSGFVDNTFDTYFNGSIGQQFCFKLCNFYEPTNSNFLDNTASYFNNLVINDFIRNALRYDFFLENYTSDTSILKKFTYGYVYNIFESELYHPKFLFLDSSADFITNDFFFKNNNKLSGYLDFFYLNTCSQVFEHDFLKNNTLYYFDKYFLNTTLKPLFNTLSVCSVIISNEFFLNFSIKIKSIFFKKTVDV